MDDIATSLPAARGFYSFMEELSAVRGSAGGSAVARVQAEPAGGGGADALRLESRANNWTEERREIGRVVVPCKCGARTCDKGCGMRLGWIARQRLLKTADEWRLPCLCTLTGDPKRFDNDPRKMFEVITQGGFIRRLFKRLGIERWVRVLEFHKSGFPHWHCMIDRGGLPRRQIDYKLAWHLWRDTWGLGGLDFTYKKKNADGSPIAGATNQIFYVTKYLTKFPADGFPAWVLNLSGIRFVQGSQDLGPLVSSPKKSGAAAEAPVKTYRARRSLGERMQGCGQGSRVYTAVEVLGGMRFEFEGVLPLSPVQLRELSDEQNVGCVIVEETVGGKPALVLIGESLPSIRSRLGFPS